MKAGVVGGGLLGRLVTQQLLQSQWKVTLFDEGSPDAEKSAAYVAAGMLAPWTELLKSEFSVFEAGLEGLKRWPNILAQLNTPVPFDQEGTVIIAHDNDRAELVRFREHLLSKLNGFPLEGRLLTREELKNLEPELKFASAFFLSQEAHLDTRILLHALLDMNANNLQCHFNNEVLRVDPHTIQTSRNTFTFDWVFDCRGSTAKASFDNLRTVRGEAIYLQAPEVILRRPVRLLHPRYPVYIVPKGHNIYYVGASEIESDDDSCISVRTCLEFLSAAFSLHSGFAEGRVIETMVGKRPAFPDHLPRIAWRDGLIRMNGLYRHGLLLAPVLVEEAFALLNNKPFRFAFPAEELE